MNFWYRRRIGALAGLPCRRWSLRTSMAFVGAVSVFLGGCGGGGSGGPGEAPSAAPQTPERAALSAQGELGRKIFFDPGLSASGRQSCASCHDPANAHAPANTLAVQVGGPLLGLQGRRQAPSIDYMSFAPAFRIGADGAPVGGLFWDGRAVSLMQQAGEPFVNPFEMANANAAELADRLARAAYAADFSGLFGAGIFGRPDDVLARAQLALSQYQKEDAGFHPFSSKYDEFLRGRAALTTQEQRGLALFNDPAKGNCAACHPSGRQADGTPPVFTDFSYDNLGVPRNPAIERNADPAYFDLGLCDRADLAGRTDLCGAFKVPSLRNVARRHAFFHNGRFASLKEAVTFYVQRDTDPARWYPMKADGSVDKFDDLPARFHANVNTAEVPYDRAPGDVPALSDAEVDDVIAFLGTLSDAQSP